MLLEVRGGALHHLLRRRGELRAQTCDHLALLVELAVQAVRVLSDPALDLADQLLLARLDALQLVGEPFLQLGDVSPPVPEPLLDRPLDRYELLAETPARVPFPLGDVPAPFL